MDEIAQAPERHHSWRLLVVLLLCAVFGAFGAIIWMAHPGDAPNGEPPLIQATLTPIKMAPKFQELLSDSAVPTTPERLLLPSPPRPLTTLATSDQADAPPDVDGTPAISNGQQIQAAALPSNERDDVNPQDREQAELTALIAGAERLDRLTNPVADARSPPLHGSTHVPEPRSPPVSIAELEGALPQREPVRAIQRDAADAAASPPPETSAPESTGAAAVTRTPVRAFRVQLAAVRAEVDAHRTWQKLQSNHDGMLSDLERHFERAETDNGIFYRIQAGPFASATAAGYLCDELKERNASCFVVRH